MAKKYVYDYPMMSFTTDIIVVKKNPKICTEDDEILLIERKNDPYKGEWVLPGGFVEANELSIDAAKRELFEETNIKVSKEYLQFLTLLDNPKRDPRGRVVSSVYFINTLTDKELSLAKAGDDANSFKWVKVSDILSDKIKLAFDHDKAIRLLYSPC